ncbi:hypothetical protein [uncultured Jatrophihabitans sp.]|uniref:hypothetical protein n=1 Tax=uncultured Jatrophihabitans sp. TaxID=1610747 RepID=UPI0035CAEFE2
MTATKRRARPHTIDAWSYGKHTAAVRGSIRVIHPVLQRHNIPWQWNHQLGVYLVSAKRIDDLLVALEVDGHHVEYRTALW